PAKREAREPGSIFPRARRVRGLAAVARDGTSRRRPGKARLAPRLLGRVVTPLAPVEKPMHRHDPRDGETDHQKWPDKHEEVEARHSRSLPSTANAQICRLSLPSHKRTQAPTDRMGCLVAPPDHKAAPRPARMHPLQSARWRPYSATTR